eukprot:scaffold34472_cov111-Phaeocystis_antarctica.AAC.1
MSTHYALLTTRTTHYALLTMHYSLLTTHYALLTTHYSLLTTHYSLLTTHYALLTLTRRGRRAAVRRGDAISQQPPHSERDRGDHSRGAPG